MSRVCNKVSYSFYVSIIEPKNVSEALLDDSLINAIHEELGKFERQCVGTCT